MFFSLLLPQEKIIPGPVPIVFSPPYRLLGRAITVPEREPEF
jgi:hypothetical protein